MRARCAARSEAGLCSDATRLRKARRQRRRRTTRTRGRSLDAAERVERGQQPALDAGDRSGEPGQRDDLAGVVGAHVHDAPARAPDDDEVAGADLMSVVGGRRNLHRVSAAGSQNLRTRVWRPAGNRRITAGERARFGVGATLMPGVGRVGAAPQHQPRHRPRVRGVQRRRAMVAPRCDAVSSQNSATRG